MTACATASGVAVGVVALQAKECLLWVASSTEETAEGRMISIREPGRGVHVLRDRAQEERNTYDARSATAPGFHGIQPGERGIGMGASEPVGRSGV